MGKAATKTARRVAFATARKVGGQDGGHWLGIDPISKGVLLWDVSDTDSLTIDTGADPDEIDAHVDYAGNYSIAYNAPTYPSDLAPNDRAFFTLGGFDSGELSSPPDCSGSFTYFAVIRPDTWTAADRLLRIYDSVGGGEIQIWTASTSPASLNLSRNLSGGTAGSTNAKLVDGELTRVMVHYDATAEEAEFRTETGTDTGVACALGTAAAPTLIAFWKRIGNVIEGDVGAYGLVPGGLFSEDRDTVWSALGTRFSEAPTITGLAYEGATLTATPTATQWYRDGVAISGARSATYTVQAADSEAVITADIFGGTKSNGLQMPSFTSLITDLRSESINADSEGALQGWPSVVSGGGEPAQATESNRPKRLYDPVFGSQKYAVVFDGNDDLVDSSPPAALSTAFAAGGSWSVEARVCIPDLVGDPYIFRFGNTSDAHYAELRIDVTGTTAALAVFKRGPLQTGTETWSKYEPARLVVTYDGSTRNLKTWVNGVADLDVTYSSTYDLTLDGTETLTLNRYQPAEFAYYRVYDKALSDTERAANDAWDAQTYTDLVPSDFLTRDPILFGLPAQSNGYFTGDWGASDFSNQSVAGVGLSRWEKTGDLYAPAVAWIQGHDTGEEVWCYGWHGETDAMNTSLADTYYTRALQMVDDVVADCPNQIVRFAWVKMNTNLDTGTYPGLATVIAAQEAIEAARPGVVTLVSWDEYNPAASGGDGTHAGPPQYQIVRRKLDVVRSAA